MDPGPWREPPETPPTPITEWNATFWGLPTLYYLVGAAFGVVFLAVGSDHVVYPTKSFFRALAVLITLAGAWAIGICLASVLFTAKTVKLTDSGNLVFISPYRELVVLPGQLTSVHTGVPLDWNRLFPWKVRADLQGSIWLWPRFPDMDRMWAAFISNSPSADLDRLSMGWVRGSSYEDEIGG